MDLLTAPSIINKNDDLFKEKSGLMGDHEFKNCYLFD